MSGTGKARPKGGRPPQRRGRGGVGPGPAYRPSSSGGGTRHKSSAVASPVVTVGAFALFLVGPLSLLGVVLMYLLHGYGVL